MLRKKTSKSYDHLKHYSRPLDVFMKHFGAASPRELGERLKGKRILEIGHGAGFLALHMREKGLVLDGVDPSETIRSVQEGIEELGGKLYKMTAESLAEKMLEAERLGKKVEKYDVVFTTGLSSLFGLLHGNWDTLSALAGSKGFATILEKIGALRILNIHNAGIVLGKPGTVYIHVTPGEDIIPHKIPAGLRILDHGPDYLILKHDPAAEETWFDPLGDGE